MQTRDSAHAVAPGTVLVAVSITSFLVPFLSSSINLALPAIGRDFEMGAVLLGWVATSFLLTTAVFLLPFGSLADLTGRVPLYRAGLLLFTASSALIALANGAPLLLTGRALQGIASAAIFGTGMAILTSAYPASERGRVLGISTAAVYAGLSLGPFLGGALTQHLGWRSIFWCNTALGGVNLILVASRLRDAASRAPASSAGAPPVSRDSRPREGLLGSTRFDLAGALLYGPAIFLFMYGMATLPRAQGAVMIVAGAAGLAAFLRHEQRVASPLLHVELLRRNLPFTLSNVAALIHYSATFAVGFLLSFFLQYIQGRSPGGAGTILIVQPAIMALLSPVTGRLSDRIEPRILASAGMLVTTIGLVLLVFLQPASSPVHVIVALAVLGIGFGLFSSPNTNAIMSAVAPPKYGFAAGMLATMRTVGQAMSMAIALLLFSLMIGGMAIGPAQHPQLLRALRLAFGLFAVLCLGGAFASAVSGRLRPAAGESAQ
ncbi:MAG: MFS transporter [Candidatus Eisenbacteria bacterium]|nr:MFS transporter [Candidatus Eisenbacteria bacterium]